MCHKSLFSLIFVKHLLALVNDEHLLVFVGSRRAFAVSFAILRVSVLLARCRVNDSPLVLNEVYIMLDSNWHQLPVRYSLIPFLKVEVRNRKQRCYGNLS